MDSPSFLGAVDLSFIDGFRLPADLSWTIDLIGRISPRALAHYIEQTEANKKCTLFDQTDKHFTANAFISKFKNHACVNCSQNGTCEAQRLLMVLHNRLLCPYAKAPQLLHSRYISPALKDAIDEWIPELPIFISAPTGSGKNTFIHDEVIPFAKNRGEYVYIFSNRLALSAQQKRSLAERYDHRKASWSDEQLVKEVIFGNCVILGYQSAVGILHDMEHALLPFTRTGYAVFDEAHYFTSDAPFSAYTEATLYKLQSTFINAVRIYMTATPQECFSVISAGEAVLRPLNYSRNSSCIARSSSFYYYNFERNFKNYNIRFFTDATLITNAILKNDTDKWLYFVSAKSKGIKLLNELNKAGSSKAAYIDASSSSKERAKDPTWMAVLTGKLPNQVLISTSVIDNGVSLTDPDLHNIVVHACDYVSLFQMIGRKRTQCNEIVNLYIHVPPKQEITAFLRNADCLLAVISNFLTHSESNFLKLYWTRLSIEMQSLFYIDEQPHLVLNYFAQYKLQRQYEHFGLLSAMANSADYKNEYAKKILKWFDLSPEDVSEFWCGAESCKLAKEKLVTLLVEKQSAPMCKACFKIFYSEAKDLIEKAINPNTDKLPRTDKTPQGFLNRSFSILQMGYQIEKRNNEFYIVPLP